MQKRETGNVSFNVTIAPARSPCGDPPSDRTGFDPVVILEAALLGTLGAIFGDLGEAAACGEPLTAEDIWADVITGSAGGIAGGLVDVFGGSPILVAIVGAFVAGFVSQALFPSSPLPKFAE